MIMSKKPVTLAEVSEIVGNPEEKKPIHLYLKKFSSLSKSEALKLIDAIKALNNPKLKEEYIIKITDFLPSDLEDINKIVPEAGLSEQEANSILDLLKKK